MKLPIDPMTGKVIRSRIHFSDIVPRTIVVHTGILCDQYDNSPHWVSANWNHVSCKWCLKLKDAYKHGMVSVLRSR